MAPDGQAQQGDDVGEARPGVVGDGEHRVEPAGAQRQVLGGWPGGRGWVDDQRQAPRGAGQGVEVGGRRVGTLRRRGRDHRLAEEVRRDIELAVRGRDADRARHRRRYALRQVERARHHLAEAPHAGAARQVAHRAHRLQLRGERVSERRRVALERRHRLAAGQRADQPLQPHASGLCALGDGEAVDVEGAGEERDNLLAAERRSEAQGVGQCLAGGGRRRGHGAQRVEGALLRTEGSGDRVQAARLGGAGAARPPDTVAEGGLEPAQVARGGAHELGVEGDRGARHAQRPLQDAAGRGAVGAAAIVDEARLRHPG
ncbi:MAG: hypothetical protein WKG00_40185, partial [Polyangiaceae bacterium]